MGKDSASLGSDEITPAKVAAIVAFFFLLVLFHFFKTNGTPATQILGDFFFGLGLFVLVWIAFDLAVVKRAGRSVHSDVDLPDSVTYERQSPVLSRDLGRRGKVALFLSALLLGSFIILTSGQQSTLSLVQAPTFQLVDPGPYGSAVLSGIAGIIENWFFFGVLLATEFALLYLAVGRRFYVAVLLVLLLNPLVFTVYHFARYSESPKALDSVYAFGFVCTGSTMLTGSLVLCDAWHFSNNFGVTFFATTPGDLLAPLAFVWIISLAGSAAYLRRGG
jgi:protein-S-isoprenylcysteine O-methyltransferase Ste14